MVFPIGLDIITITSRRLGNIINLSYDRRYPKWRSTVHWGRHNWDNLKP